MNSELGTCSLTELVARFNASPIGHPLRKQVISEIARRGISLLLGPQLVQHRTGSDASRYYVASAQNLIFTDHADKKKVTIGTIGSISILQTSSTQHIELHLLQGEHL